ncbi:tetratricopeptide repeat protein 21B-like [Drosophila busckii]|uniref:tetratricopeptide repeat protein 21B-like n=1 Tax=Drosophila busckii TaxID=30019 RepID=UPI00083ED210|nr:tetratricopeptide repeat protein 21B-like [Drosophila busckii]
MNANEYRSLVLYYGRLRFYHSMQKMALDGLAKFPMQSEFRMFNGVALALGNRMQECIRELNPLKNEPDFGLAATMMLIYAHRHCRIIDIETVQSLERRLEDRTEAINASSYYYAGVFLFLIGEFNAAIDNLGKSLKADVTFDAAVVLKIWCQLSCSNGQHVVNGKTQSILEASIARNDGKNIDASLALIRFYQKRKEFDSALLVINKLSVRFPDLSIPLIEKMETQLAAHDWEHALETGKKVVNMEPTNVSAIRITGLLQIVRESNLKGATGTLNKLLNAVERVEPGNHMLLLDICKLYSRVCSRNIELLQITQRTVDKLTQLNPANIDLLTELGHQKLLMGNFAEAEKTFHAACNLESNNFKALCGLTLCKLKGQRNDESRQQTRQQLDYLMELNDNNLNAIVLYMSALICDQREKQSAVQLLVKATEVHIKKLDNLCLNVDYICLLNPDFMLAICEELITYTPAPVQGPHFELDVGHETLHITLKHSLNILEVILQSCPGHQEAMFMRARVDFLCGESTKAIARLQHILSVVSESFTKAHLLLAQILVERQQYAKAMESLELSLSQDFKVRELPIFHLLKGIIQRHQQMLPEAHHSLLCAMQLIGNTSGIIEQHQNTIVSQSTIITAFDKMTLYIELIHVLRIMGDSQGFYESERLLEVANEEFCNSAELGRLIIAHAQLMLDMCNVDKAISLLSTIKPEQPYYIHARTQLANIFLQHQKNRSAFSKCFKELVKVRPEPKSFLMLGEAYLSIQEIDKAIDAYGRAFKMNPLNSLLASKLGRAYVKSHQYAKALRYYNEVVKNAECSPLKLDLAELFLKLKQFQSAVNILTDSAKSRIKEDSFVDLQLRTKKLLLLARVHEKSGNIMMSIQTLQEARENQYRLQKQCSIDQSEIIAEQYKAMSKICLLIAQQAIHMKSNEMALTYFKECMKYTPNDLEILVSLAQLQMNSKEMNMCRDTCFEILQIDNNNEAASVIMADLSFRKMEFENAAYHFSQLLLSQPCNWAALARLIEVMRRSGTINESIPFLQRAEQSFLNSTNNSAGLNYCNGLFQYYNGNPNSALRYFNLSRRDHEWGYQSRLNMIEICINPDGEIPNVNDLFEAGDSGEFTESRIVALRTAERLLNEMRTQAGEIHEKDISRRVLWNFLQMASKQKMQVESSLQDLTELMQQEGNSLMVPIVYAMASALIQLKQIQRAKNQLKRIARLTWYYEDAEYLERSWLLLADIYINANKLDVATTFVDRVLDYNKSSTKGYELAGYIAEKMQSYSDASLYYQKAWISCDRSKPHIGYKLAFNNMKKKQYANAVNICQQVLKLHPDYTIIRKDILEKCRNNLRP